MRRSGAIEGPVGSGAHPEKKSPNWGAGTGKPSVECASSARKQIGTSARSGGGRALRADRTTASFARRIVQGCREAHVRQGRIGDGSGASSTRVATENRCLTSLSAIPTQSGDPELPGEMPTAVSSKKVFCGTELDGVQEAPPAPCRLKPAISAGKSR